MAIMALGIIDAQCGLMPAKEGKRLGQRGFGELPVPDGETIVPAVNALLTGYAECGDTIFTTQDWHPRHTAHFSAKPDYHTTWPRHCVARTPGARLHPDIILPRTVFVEEFKKGLEILEYAEFDTSYSGHNAVNLEGIPLGNWLQAHAITDVALAGLALDRCIANTAFSLLDLGIQVSVATDATKSRDRSATRPTLKKLAQAGIGLFSTRQLLWRLGDHHRDERRRTRREATRQDTKYRIVTRSVS